jgi:predicted nucleotidyltransferase
VPLPPSKIKRGENLSHQEKYLQEVKQILSQFNQLVSFDVFLFGSRANGTAHSKSDIDIGVLGNEPLPSLLKLNIEERLEDSNVPVNIELVDFFYADTAFKEIAFKNRIYWNLKRGTVSD